MSETLTDAEIKERYIAFRTNPANIQFNDGYFCSTNSVSLDRLRKVIEENPDIAQKINSREVTDKEMSTLLGLLLRLCYEKAFIDKIPVKSLEGLIAGIVALMKQRQLESGKPTEIVEFKELESKTPEELHAHLLGLLRHDRNIGRG